MYTTQYYQFATQKRKILLSLLILRPSPPPPRKKQKEKHAKSFPLHSQSQRSIEKAKQRMIRLKRLIVACKTTKTKISSHFLCFSSSRVFPASSSSSSFFSSKRICYSRLFFQWKLIEEEKLFGNFFHESFSAKEKLTNFVTMRWNLWRWKNTFLFFAYADSINQDNVFRFCATSNSVNLFTPQIH